MRCSEIHQKFVKYYQQCGYIFLPRASMLHPSIPMSFVMSAGLEQIETSLAEANNRSGNKFVMVQDCFRHFDLDSVGVDNSHLSLFEMPGAFIFGKNGRENTVTHMWKLATEVMGIDPKRIWISYFGGDKLADQELPEDLPTYQVWQKIGIPQNRLVSLGIEHNYWIQGNGIQNGKPLLRKCGPSTELFYDTGSDNACGPDCIPNCRCGRFIEFSNSLFITHNIGYEDNVLKPMDEPFSETVVGTERLAMILQNAPSVFDTKDYLPLTDTIHRFATRHDLPAALTGTCERVIADHLKALCMLVGDGAPPPGKDGRARIIKLLIRKVLTRQIVLGINSEEFLSTLITLVAENLDNGNKQSQATKEKIISYFESESQRFQKTVNRGQLKVDKILTKNKGDTLSGSQILSLEKKWGLPHLIIRVILHKKGLSFAKTEYNKELNVWKQVIRQRI